MVDASAPDLDVLLVEDNSALAASLRTFLQGQGVETDVVSDADAALARIEACRVRLALVSTGLPGRGLDATRRIRAIVGRKPMVLLMSTTRPTGRVLKEAQAAGAEGVAQKLGGPRAILERVRRLLPGVGAAAGRSPAAPKTGSAAPAAGAARKRPAPHPHPLRAARQLPRGVQVDGKVKPEVAQALSQLKRREEPDDAWSQTVGGGGSGGADDLLSDDPLFASGGGGGYGGLSRAEEEFRKGRADFDGARYEDALQRFVNAWSLEPSTPIYLAYKIRTQALMAASPPDPDGDMGDDLRMAAMLDPKLVEPPLFLGHLYLAAGRPEDARKHFKTVLDLEPGHADAKAALAKIVNRT